MSVQIDREGALQLLGEIVRQWKLDAQRSPYELRALAAWLEVTPAEAQRMLNPGPRPKLRSARRPRPSAFDDL